MIPIRVTLAASCLAYFLGAASPAQAQKADPKPIAPVELQAPDADAWAEAYAQMDYPRTLVIVGRDARTGGQGLFDPPSSGFAAQFKAELERLLNHPDADLDLVDAEALTAATQRLSDQLAAADERVAIGLLADELQVDLVLAVKFLGVDPQGLTDPSGQSARMEYRLVSLSRGRTLSNQAFEWKHDTSLPWIKRYANDLAVKLFDDVAARSANPSRFTVRVLGLGDDARAIAEARQALRELRGVETVRAPKVSTFADPATGARDSMHTYEIRFTGDALDLAAGITEVHDSVEGVQLRVVQAEPGIVTVRAREPEVTVVPVALPLAECHDLITSATPAGEIHRELLRRLYAEQNSPRLTVLVNRAATRQEIELAGQSEGGLNADTLVLVQTGTINSVDGSAAPDLIVQPEGDDFRLIPALETQARAFETALFDRLGTNLLGFKRADAETARALLQARGEGSGLLAQREIVELLRAGDVADIVLFGYGSTLAQSGGGVVATYTFKAVNLADSAYLAGATVSAPLGPVIDVAAVDRLATEAIGQIACELMQEWSPPTPLEATITGAQDAGDMDLLLQAVATLRAERSGPISVLGSPSFRDGTIRLTLQYTCAFDELFAAVRDLSGELPYTLALQSLETNTMTLAISR